MDVKFLDLDRLNKSFGSELADACTEVVNSGWYIHGSRVSAFEAAWSAYCQRSYTVGVGSGLDALRLVLTAWKIMYGWSDGDEVIMPANTFIATALAVTQAGLKPVFCDVNESDALIVSDTSYLSTLLTERTRCIIPVHLYGNLVDIKSIYAFARTHGLLVLEDACQAHGAHMECAEQRTCAYSFYPGKNLGALGDGGCVSTDDPETEQIVRRLANYGQTKKYVHELPGINSRLDEIQAAMLMVKLKRLDADNDRRREIAAYYEDALADYKKPCCLSDANVFHIYPFRHARRNNLQLALADRGVQTLIHYPIPCHKQNSYAEYNGQTIPNAELWCRETLSLPMSPVMTDDEAEYVVKSVIEALQSLK